jgi:hypothetical protein
MTADRSISALPLVIPPGLRLLAWSTVLIAAGCNRR